MVSQAGDKTTFRPGKSRLRRFIGAVFRVTALTVVGIVALGGGILAWVYAEFESDLPTSLDAITDYSPMRASQVLSADGEVIGEFFVEKRVLVPIESIPEVVRNAFVAAEDQRFFEHGGIDYQGIARAAYANYRAGTIVQGGSTITQQVAKLLILGKERSLARKIREALLAHRIEARLNKQAILGIYLNHVYLGHGAYGIGAAASAYFGKNVEDLSAGEAAMLAAMPKAPGRATPFRDFDKAKARQAYVLRQMEGAGYLTADQADAARKEALVLVSRGSSVRNVAAPYFVEDIRKVIAERYGDDELLRDGLRIQTTLDMRLQRAAEAAVRSGLEDLERRLGFSGPIEHLTGDRFDVFQQGLPRPFGPDGYDADDPEQQGFLVPGDAPTTEADEAIMLDATQAGTRLSDKQARKAVIRAELARQKLAKKQAKAARRRKPAKAEPTPAPVPTPDPDTVYSAAIVAIQAPPPKLQSQEKADDPRLRRKYKHPDGRMHVASGAVRAELDRDSVARLARWTDDAGSALRVGDVIPVHFDTVSERGQSKLQARLAARPTVQAALVAVDPATGHLLAMVGGYDFEKSQFNRATQAKRQVGSSIKPFIYAAAIEKGMTPLTIRWDIPVRFRTATGVWSPRNYKPEFKGRVTLRTALEKSINTVAAQLAVEMGIGRIIGLLRSAGVESELPHQLSLSLGAADLSPHEMAYAMATFPAGGRRVHPISITRVLDGDRRALDFQKQPAANEATPVVSQQTAFIVTHMMKAVAESGTARKARALGRPVAGKTGTSTAYRDAWFVGFSPELLCAVWVGRDDFQPIGHDVTGGRVALPIWLDFMKEATRGLPVADFVPPKGTLFVRADPETGMPALPSERKSRLIPLRQGTLSPAFRGPAHKGGFGPASQTGF